MNDSICEITVIRHGETDANRAHILQGHLQSHLNQTGVQQAECLARRLSSEKFDVLYSSNLDRAMLTASIIGKAVRLSPVPEDDLSEWRLGILEGHTHEELDKRYPELMAAFHKESPSINVPNGESKAIFYSRVFRIFSRIASENPGKKVLVVSHGGVIRALFQLAVGPVPVNFLPTIGNASCSRFIFRENLWQLVTWNDISHLQSLHASCMVL